jgi:serine/threonine protein kinase
MDRFANAAPFAFDASLASPESCFGEQTRVRAIAGILPEGKVSTQDRLGEARLSAHGRPRLLAPGTCVDGKYIICDVLGMGGAAVVYAAEQVGLKRVVAFKLYSMESGTTAQLLERFQREAELLARIHHENVVAVFDSGIMFDGSPYLVVQRLSGESLAARLAEGGLSMGEAVQLARQALHALVALGDAGITHRDVKPDNLVLDRLPDGSTVLKLVDFGIAKEIAAQVPGVPEDLVGTPHYMAPEQVRGEPLDARCDLYALGATLYEMLTGRPPHTGETLHDLATATLFDPIIPVRALRPECPERLEQIVMRALEREPGARFCTAREMRSALDAFEASEREPPRRRATLRVADEDTLRIPTHRPDGPHVRARARKLGLALVASLALAGGVTVSRELHRQYAPLSSLTTQVEANQSSTLELALQSSAFAGALMLETRTLALALWNGAQVALEQLVETVGTWTHEDNAPLPR